MTQMAHEWINRRYLDGKDAIKIKRRFANANPYPHLALDSFLSNQAAYDLANAVLKEKFERHDKDLFSFSSTKELISADSKLVKDFYRFFSSDEIFSIVSGLTGENGFKAIDMHAHLFRQGDYLLFHDDVVEGRAIAYIIYLSKGFKGKDGGRLQLYDIKNSSKPVKQIVPKFGSFVCFKVSKKSLHAVEEIRSKKERLTVGGWFYGD